MVVQTMMDHFKWPLVGPTKTYVTMNCPTPDAGVKSELDVQAPVSLPSYGNKLSHIVVSTTYDPQLNLITHVT